MQFDLPKVLKSTPAPAHQIDEARGQLASFCETLWSA